MAKFDSDRNMWKDNAGMYHHSREDAINANSSGGKNFGTEAAGAGGGCAGILLIGSAAIVALVGAIAYLWQFAVVLLIAIVFMWIIAELYDRGKLKSKKTYYLPTIAVVIISLPFFIHIKSNENFVPTIAGTAAVTPEGAGTVASYRKKGIFSSKLVFKDSITLIANEKVELFRSKVGANYIEIEKSDGTKGFVYGRKYLTVNGQEKTVNVFDKKDITLLNPRKFWARVWKMDFRPARPFMLQDGEYFPEGGNVEGIVRIKTWQQPKYFNEKKWKAGNISFYTGETDFISCDKFIVKNDPPVEINGIPYNFSLYVTTDEGKTFDFVITSTSTLTGKDGKVIYRLKEEKKY